MIDLVPVLIDQPFDLFATRARLWSGIRYRTTEPNVIAYEIGTCRILELILHVRLLHLEVTVDVATVVSFPAFRHLLMLRARDRQLLGATAP